MQRPPGKQAPNRVTAAVLHLLKMDELSFRTGKVNAVDYEQLAQARLAATAKKNEKKDGGIFESLLRVPKALLQAGQEMYSPTQKEQVIPDDDETKFLKHLQHQMTRTSELLPTDAGGADPRVYKLVTSHLNRIAEYLHHQALEKESRARPVDPTAAKREDAKKQLLLEAQTHAGNALSTATSLGYAGNTPTPGQLMHSPTYRVTFNYEGTQTTIDGVPLSRLTDP